MDEFIDKAKGAANQASGKVKVAVGRKTDKLGLIIKGAAEQGKGKAEKLAGAVSRPILMPSCRSRSRSIRLPANGNIG